MAHTPAKTDPNREKELRRQKGEEPQKGGKQ